MGRRRGPKRQPVSKQERPKPPVHVGNLVRRYLREQKIQRAMLAKETNRALITVTRQLRKDSMQVALLFEFCMALKHNFFAELAQALPPDFSGKGVEQKRLFDEMEAQIAALLDENERLKAELKLMSGRFDLLLKKL